MDESNLKTKNISLKSYFGIVSHVTDADPPQETSCGLNKLQCN